MVDCISAYASSAIMSSYHFRLLMIGNKATLVTKLGCLFRQHKENRPLLGITSWEQTTLFWNAKKNIAFLGTCFVTMGFRRGKTGRLRQSVPRGCSKWHDARQRFVDFLLSLHLTNEENSELSHSQVVLQLRRSGHMISSMFVQIC